MKFNWGTGIVLAFVAFISFIMYFVIRMNTDNRTDHELVTKDYYKQELAYQKEIDAEKNAAELDEELSVRKSEDGLLITFPKNFNPKNVTGKVSLYRPSNRHLDFNFPISLSNTHLLIPDNRLVDGRWDIAIEWHYKGKTFLHKQKLTY
ncbi:FixH family protein [Muricauda sp. SCSIO 64092]|uniref:FixH family protein n=1 Tax=Allomuricauda sp. SCSIO 64092 TaxID=2908842 RepID=UPI001FF11AFC|nr:FixH family protein [Muricauda sp. SCSIO 64092]UOY07955.1 FixH family protein [Muricauda sp. SCSIO 64092]